MTQGCKALDSLIIVGKFIVAGCPEDAFIPFPIPQSQTGNTP
jgi:hypothetical protein